MRSTLILLTIAGAVLLVSNVGTVSAWNRQLFQRYSRNFLRNPDVGAINAINGITGINGIGDNNEIDEINALFGMNNDGGGGGGGGGGGNSAGGSANGGSAAGASVRSAGYAAFGLDDGDVNGGNGQQTEVYGIVEPLIEDMPCVDRPCNTNDDCCPTGVCVNTYGEGKCIYVYGRKRDLCRRNADCGPGMQCQRGAGGNYVCQLTTLASQQSVRLLDAGTVLGSGNNVRRNGAYTGANAISVAHPAVAASKSMEFLRQFGESCISSSDCNVSKGMCCQLQRTHHRMQPKKMCTYFRDPFMCIDIMPPEEEENRESRFLSSFTHRRM